MTGFWDSGEKMSASERRLQRMEEARRRVETGEVTPPRPSAAQQPANTKAATATKVAVVDPTAVAGAKYGVWRSVQHFCITDSVADAISSNLDRLVAWSDSIQQFRLRQRIVARLDSEGAWMPVAYAKDGAREAITQAQAERYREVRLGESTLSGGAQKPLKETDHPEATTSL